MIRVFPRLTKWTPTDALAFVGDPPLFRPPEQPVAVSVTFAGDIPEGKRLQGAWSSHYPDVRLGGPAFGDPGGEFTPGQFLKPGVTITSRGCPCSCPWCFVPGREGKIREYTIQPGYIVQDNNLLACSRGHIEAVFEMLKHQDAAAIFSGGLDVRLLRPWHRALIDNIRVNELWFACDSALVVPHLRKAAELLEGIPIRKRRCYVMIGFSQFFRGESIVDAERRLEAVYEMGFLPFSQLYRGPGERKYDREWKALNKKWSRPAAYRTDRVAR
jgi:hypothetical protein